ncbi:MAG: DUF4037 domain-containing protein [Oscillospiraceae bacterium]|nr:DUF4037 domain-containing protein [Oscillospiraceae bacterium]
MYDINRIFDGFKAFSQTEAIALGGSRSTGLNDESSDYDVYVYLSAEIPETERCDLLSRYCQVTEIGNHYWEYEDNCILNGGVPIDIIYRDMGSFDDGLRRTVTDCIPSNAYTTCMWHNLLNSEIIFDRTGSLAALKEKYRVPYPEKLRENIIRRGRQLLSGCIPSYDMQIKKAVQRGDSNAVTHRTTEFLASYYDVIFALNRLTHPGEKRLAEICAAKCGLLPNNFGENLDRLFAELYTEKTPENISRIVSELDAVIEKEKSKGGLKP